MDDARVADRSQMGHEHTPGHEHAFVRERRKTRVNRWNITQVNSRGEINTRIARSGFLYVSSVNLADGDMEMTRGTEHS